MERRHYGQLSLTERIEIYRLHADGKSLRFIAKSIGRSPSTISRELRRNGKDGYDPQRAHKRYRRRHARGRRHKLDRQPNLRKRVLDLLAMERSPEQIAGRLALENAKPLISHESIYRYIYWHSYHFRDKELHKLLPQQQRTRKPRHPHKAAGRAIPGRVPLSKRPLGAQNRSRYGHWEADLMQFSTPGKVVLVLHDRRSRYTSLRAQYTKKAPETINTLHSILNDLPEHRRKSVTFDNGQEFRLHTQLTLDKAIQTFFCDPHAPWQKGGVENTIKRLRRFLPRKTNPDTIDDQTLENIMNKINNTPRKCLGFKTPAEAFFKQNVALQT